MNETTEPTVDAMQSKLVQLQADPFLQALGETAELINDLRS